MIKVAIIGGGTMGRVHGDAYKALPNAEIAAVIDVNAETKTLCAEKWCVPGFGSLKDAAEAVEFDMVDICLPTPFHKPLIFEAMELDKHILCEKPLARTNKDCLEIADRVNGYNKKFMVAHVLRFFQEYVKARDIINSGALGKPGMVRTTRAGWYPRASGDWYARAQNSGGPILDMLIHDIDFLRWCFGEAERVFAKALTFKGYEYLDYALITLRFRSGVIAHLEASWAQTPGAAFEARLEVAGSGGLLMFDNQDSIPLKYATRQPRAEGGVAVPESPVADSPYLLEIKHFLDCVENHKKPSITVEDAFAAVRIALAALESAETGSVITLDRGVRNHA